MSSHRRRVKHFSRKSTARVALFRGLMVSLVEHGRIATTVDKAKELRRHIEKAITLGKKDDLNSRRLLLSRIPNEGAVSTIMGDISKRFKDRPGGYTRIIKIGRRPGDTAEMAFIEFVDYDWSKKAKPADEVADEKAEKTAKAAGAKTAKKVAKTVASKKKTAKKGQKKSRASARA
jgi:large subunit ribosomal protein L17